MNNTHFCTACDTVQGARDGYCEQCGGELQPVRYCDNCGVAATHQGKFCRECGTALPDASLPPPVVVPPPPPPPPVVVKSAPQKVPTPKPLAPSSPAPLAHRPVADPVPMRSAPLARATTTNTALTGFAGVAGAVALFALATGSPPVALVFFVLMFVMGGVGLRNTAANGVNRVVDWIWEDPILRRRLLGE